MLYCKQMICEADQEEKEKKIMQSDRKYKCMKGKNGQKYRG